MISEIELRDYQQAAVDKLYPIIKEHKIAYLAWEEQTGKTYTALELFHKLKAENILVITTASARDKTWAKIPIYKGIYIKAVSFESAPSTLKEKYYKYILIDEAHNHLSAAPKLGLYAKGIKMALHSYLYIGKTKYIVYLSATPYAQHVGQLYSQFSITPNSPWKAYSTYYHWYKHYGTEQTIYLKGIQIKDYKNFSPDQKKRILFETQHLFSYMTRAQIGFKQHPKDIIHKIPLFKPTKEAYNKLLKDRVLTFWHKGEQYEVYHDNPAKCLHLLASLEGGTIITNENELLVLKNTEKVDYILSTWGDTEDMVIMYYYQAEEQKLKEVFKKAQILQSTTFAESISLAKFKHLIIYSQDWRTAKYIQRRARQCSLEREDPINVHFLLTPKGISEKIYQTVSVNGKNFNANREEHSLETL